MHADLNIRCRTPRIVRISLKEVAPHIFVRSILKYCHSTQFGCTNISRPIEEPFWRTIQILEEWFHTHCVGKLRYVVGQACGYFLFALNHIVNIVFYASGSVTILKRFSLSLNTTNCSLSKWYWNFCTEGYWCCKLNSKIRQHDSIADT